MIKPYVYFYRFLLKIVKHVEKINKALHPTDTGEVVSDFLKIHYANIFQMILPKMEDELDQIADGKLTYKKLLTDFYKPFQKIKEKIK